MELVPRIVDGLEAADAGDLPVIVGGSIPEATRRLRARWGVAAVFTPKDFGLTEIMDGVVDVIRALRGLSTRCVTGPDPRHGMADSRPVA